MKKQEREPEQTLVRQVDGHLTANTAESLLREFARKRTNKGRAAEELAKSAATLGLPAQANQQRSCCCRGVCRDRCCRSDVPGARI